MKLSRLERKLIEEYWKDIDYYRKKRDFRFWEITEQKEVDTNVGGGKSSGISDTTSRKAMLLVEDGTYQHYKKIVDAIEGTYDEINDDLKEIVHTRFWDKEDYLEWDEMSEFLGISRRTLFRRRRVLIDKTAKRLGWL